MQRINQADYEYTDSKGAINSQYTGMTNEDDDSINREVAQINKVKKQQPFKLPIKDFVMNGDPISKTDHIMIQDNNIFAGLDSTHRDKIQEMKQNLNTNTNFDILIKESGEDTTPAPKEVGHGLLTNPGNSKSLKVVAYETFESSSEDEFSQGAFESAAQSFTNNEKNGLDNKSQLIEHKRIERQRRKERK